MVEERPKMKYLIVKYFIFAFFLQCFVTADPITLAAVMSSAVQVKDVFLLVKNAVTAHAESGNWKEFFEKLDPVIRHQKHLECKLPEGY